MGHNEVARLPTSQRWRVVVGLLNSPQLNSPGVSSAVTAAAERRLRELGDDPSLTYCFWTLTRLASAARGRGAGGSAFIGEVSALGIPAEPGESALRFLARVADHTRERLSEYPESGPFGDIAATALRQALAETVGTRGRSLFGSSLDDLEAAFRRHATPTQFGDLAHRFFASFMGQTLRYYVDRELPHVIGSTAVEDVSDATAFAQALDRHSRDLARVIERYAVDWYNKKNWERLGEISEEDAQGFIRHALPKLRSATKRGDR